MNLICTSHPKRDWADYVCCPSLLKKECLTEIFLVTDFWGMGKDHFSDYFKIHDEIHLRCTEFIFQNLTFWKKKSFYFGWRISWWYMYTWQKLCPFKTSCEFYNSYPSRHFKNALYSQISKILKKKIFNWILYIMYFLSD